MEILKAEQRRAWIAAQPDHTIEFIVGNTHEKLTRVDEDGKKWVKHRWTAFLRLDCEYCQYSKQLHTLIKQVSFGLRSTFKEPEAIV